LKKIAEVEAIHVLPTYQQKKIGTHLIKKFRTWAKKRNADAVEIKVHAQNESGSRFWKNIGFTETAIRMRFRFRSK